MRDYSKHAHDNNWEATGGREIVGRRGWPREKLTDGGRPMPGESPEEWPGGRHLASPTDTGEEYWQLSQSGVRILFGSKSTGLRASNVVVWVEDPAQFATEQDIFRFVHAEYLEPEERCA